MKLKHLMMAIALFASSFAFAGGIGIRGGWQNAMTVNGSNKVDNPIPGFYAGFFHTSYPLGIKILGIQSGLEFSQQGHRKDDDNYRRQNYVGIPLGLRLKLGPIFAIGGLNANFKISEKYVVAAQEVTNDKSKGFDAHWHAGLGFKFAIFSIEGRYHQGLININDGNKTNYLQLGGAISF